MLAAEVPKIVTSPAYQRGDVDVFIGFDEGEGGSAGMDCLASTDPSCTMPLVVVSPSTRPGTVSTATYSHYSLLRTTLELLGVNPALGLAATAPSLRAWFNL